MSTLGGGTLAAVFTPNPHHPLTWVNFVGYLLLIGGCGIACIGVYAGAHTYRGLEPSRRRGQVVPITLFAGFFLLVGSALAALGVWLF